MRLNIQIKSVFILLIILLFSCSKDNKDSEYFYSQLKSLNFNDIAKGYEDLINLYKEAENIGDPQILGIINLKMGTYLYFLEDYKDANKKLSSAINLFKQSKDTSRELSSTLFAIINLQNINNIAFACNLIKNASAINDTTYKSELKERILYKYVYLLILNGEAENAVKYLKIAYNNSLPSTNKYKDIKLNYFNSRICGIKKDTLLQLDYLKKMYKGIISIYGENIPIAAFPALNELGQIHIDKGEFKRAREILDLVIYTPLPFSEKEEFLTLVTLNTHREKLTALKLMDSIAFVNNDLDMINQYSPLYRKEANILSILEQKKGVQEAKINIAERINKRELQQQTKERERLIIVNIVLTVVILLIISSLFIYIDLKKKILKKNIALNNYIKKKSVICGEEVIITNIEHHIIKTSKELNNNKKKYENENNNSEEIKYREDKSEKTVKAENNISTIITPELFYKLDSLIKEKKLYLNPSFKRKDLAEMLSTNETYIYHAIKKYSDYSSFTDYLNTLRIHYSCYLISENPLQSFEIIAEQSGFNVRSTFYRAFSIVMNMTPKEYRVVVEREGIDSNLKNVK